MKLLTLLNLLGKFVKTEVISALELILWLTIKNSPIYQIFWQSDVVRPAMALGLLAVPVISAVIDYQSNKRDIDSLLRELSY